MIPREELSIYNHQRLNARYRGIAWEISFPEWWCLWLESGKWEQRGKRIGQYVMSRLKDVGPYKIGNVEIVTCSKNCSDGRSLTHARIRASTQMTRRTRKT